MLYTHTLQNKWIRRRDRIGRLVFNQTVTTMKNNPCLDLSIDLVLRPRALSTTLLFLYLLLQFWIFFFFFLNILDFLILGSNCSFLRQQMRPRVSIPLTLPFQWTFYAIRWQFADETIVSVHYDFVLRLMVPFLSKAWLFFLGWTIVSFRPATFA